MCSTFPELPRQCPSGRLLQSMLEGAGAMFGLWLSFFRENCASFFALFLLLPATLFYNWRLASLLIVMVAVFYVVTTYVLRRTDTLQAAVEHYNAALASRASDALGNIPVVQSLPGRTANPRRCAA